MMYLPSAENIPSPYFAIEKAINDITPIGDVSITISKSLKNIALKVLIKVTTILVKAILGIMTG